MEIEYIRIKRFNQEIEKVYATGFDLLGQSEKPVAILAIIV